MHKPLAPPAAHPDQAALLQQQLDLERQKAEFERQKLEHQLATERQKLAQIEVDAAKARAEDLATRYSDSEFAAVRQHFIEQGNSIGEALLARTHPTGDYSYTDRPSVNLSSERTAITVQVAVRWTGGFVSENTYTTVYSVRITKKGVDRLEVLRDSALVKIDPQFLRSAELDLRSVFDSK